MLYAHYQHNKKLVGPIVRMDCQVTHIDQVTRVVDLVMTLFNQQLFGKTALPRLKILHRKDKPNSTLTFVWMAGTPERSRIVLYSSLIRMQSPVFDQVHFAN